MEDTPVKPTTLVTVKLVDGHHKVLTNVKSWHFTATGNFLVVERLVNMDDLVVTKIDHCEPKELETVLINRDSIAEVAITVQVPYKTSKVIPIKQGKRHYLMTPQTPQDGV